MPQHQNTGISIKQIAQLTGLSVATVSRVINRKGYYSQAAEEKVRRVAEEYHYVPNLIARSLKTRRTDTIGVIIPDINGDFFARAVLQLQLGFFAHGYSTIIFNTNHDLKLADACMNMMRSNQVSGIVNFTGAVIAEEYAAHVPVLYFDRKPDDDTAGPYLVGDNRMGGYLAGELLARRGCRRPAVLVPANLSANHTGRLEGFLSAMRTADLEEQTLSIRAGGFTIEDGSAAMIPRLLGGDCDGVFCVNDYLTTGVLQAVRHLGLDVPQRLRIVGYDVDSVLRLIRPTFTTIVQPLEQMTSLAVENLLRLINGEDVDSVTLPVRLVTGETA